MGPWYLAVLRLALSRAFKVTKNKGRRTTKDEGHSRRETRRTAYVARDSSSCRVFVRSFWTLNGFSRSCTPGSRKPCAVVI